MAQDKFSSKQLIDLYSLEKNRLSKSFQKRVIQVINHKYVL